MKNNFVKIFENTAIKIYQTLFAKKIFYQLNFYLFQLALRGMGILNHQNSIVSGENYFLKRILKKFNKPIIIDIGANKGNYSVSCKKINKNAEIFALEPHPKTYKILLSKAKEFKFKSFNLASGNEQGNIKFYDYKDNDGSEHASLLKDVIEKIHNASAVEHCVEIIKLDDFVVNNQINHINLLKIDTEGYEMEVLKGAEKLIEENKIDCIHFEFNETNVISRVFLKDFMEKLTGYKFYRLLPDGLLDINQYKPLNEIFAFQNIIALRADSI